MENGDRQDATIRAPAARQGGHAPQPGGGLLFTPPSHEVVTPSPAVPTFQGASDSEVIAELARANTTLEGEKKMLQFSCSTIANAALSLAKLLIENGVGGDGEVVVPKEITQQSAGGRLTLDEDGDGNLVIRIRDRVERDFGIEG